MAHTITKVAERPRPFGIKEAYFTVTVGGDYETSVGIEFDPSDYALGTVKYANANLFLDATGLVVQPVVDITNSAIYLYREDASGITAGVASNDSDVSGVSFYVNVVGVGV